MKPFWDSCKKTKIRCGKAELTLLSLSALSDGAKAVLVERCQEHYVDRNLWLSTFGRDSLANKLKDVVPALKRARSGDLGEILATEYVNLKEWGYEVPILKLRWKDGRELALRGEDAVGFKLSSNPIGLLKVEAKSRAYLSAAVLSEAREALDNGQGRPSPFVLTFIVSRLMQQGNVALAQTIDAQTTGARLLDARELAHLLFVFCGNDPEACLKKHLAPLPNKPATQFAVAVHHENHQSLIETVFTEAANA
jgi:hypothetical protein